MRTNDPCPPKRRLAVRTHAPPCDRSGRTIRPVLTDGCVPSGPNVPARAPPRHAPGTPQARPRHARRAPAPRAATQCADLDTTPHLTQPASQPASQPGGPRSLLGQAILSARRPSRRHSAARPAGRAGRAEPGAQACFHCCCGARKRRHIEGSPLCVAARRGCERC